MTADERAAAAEAAETAEDAAERANLAAPLGEARSGLVRYAAAMHFWRRGRLGAEALEVFRICARMDAEDPAAWARSRGVDWRPVEALIRRG
jgi:hypothetical protein